MNPQQSMGVAIGLLLVALSACGAEQRPSLDTWLDTWRSVQQIVPEAHELSQLPREEECNEILGSLRAAAPRLHPAPDEIIGTTANAWLSYAESVFFDCFRSVGTQDPVGTAYERLDRLEAEVETAIRTRSTPGSPTSAERKDG